jgi:hypothetical protein
VPKLSFRIEYQYGNERGILLPVALRYAGRETASSRAWTPGHHSAFSNDCTRKWSASWWSQASQREFSVTGGFLNYWFQEITKCQRQADCQSAAGYQPVGMVLRATKGDENAPASGVFGEPRKGWAGG